MKLKICSYGFGGAVLAGTFLLCSCASSHPFKDAELERSFQPDRKQQLDVQAFEKALQGGANPNLELKNGGTPLIMAVLRNRPDYVRTLLQYKADVNKAGRRGSTPLHVAAGQNRPECLELLLDAGADVNAHGTFGRTPLMESARTGNLEAMKKLLDAGADIGETDSKGRTALMHAAEAQRNTLEAVKLLIARGADPMAYDSDVRLAVMHAAALKHTDAALYLLDLIPDLPKKPGLGLMIMHSAIKGNDLKVMDKLIDRRVPLNRSLSVVLKGTRILQIHGFYRILIRNGLLGKGRVPLHWAAIDNNLDAVKLLIDRGADPLQPDELGHYADALATSREVIHYIRKKQSETLRKYREMEENK